MKARENDPPKFWRKLETELQSDFFNAGVGPMLRCLFSPDSFELEKSVQRAISEKRNETERECVCKVWEREREIERESVCVRVRDRKGFFWEPGSGAELIFGTKVLSHDLALAHPTFACGGNGCGGGLGCGSRGHSIALKLVTHV